MEAEDTPTRHYSCPLASFAGPGHSPSGPCGSGPVDTRARAALGGVANLTAKVKGERLFF